jgi:hypothetical protein
MSDEAAAGLPFEEAIGYFRAKTNVPTEGWTDLWQGEHVRAFSVAGAAGEALLQDFRREVDRAIAEGRPYGEFRAAFDEIVRRHGWSHTGTADRRARVIYHTNLAMAFSAGRYAQMSDPYVLALHPYWQYRHSGAKHPRLDHLKWDGTVLRADDPFWRVAWPPNGWGCGCYVSPVTRRAVRRMGLDGPMRAPNLETWAETDAATGRRITRVQGIDKGFAYNPGLERFGPVAIPAAIAARIPPPPGVAAVSAATVPTFTGAAEAEAALAAATAPWRRSLDATERAAIDAWRGPASFDIARGLRAGTIAAEDAPIVDALDGALATARTPFALVVWRGIRDRAALGRLIPGEVVTDAAFVATATRKRAARGFAGGARGMVLEIRVPAGTAAAWLKGLGPAAFRDQPELLLARGTRFRVVSVAADERSAVLEVLP